MSVVWYAACASEGTSSVNMHVIKRLMANYDTPTQYLKKFSGQIF